MAAVLAGEVDEARKLLAHGTRIFADGFERQKLAFGGAAARVADHSGGAAHQHNGAMTGALESRKHQRGQQMADVETVGGGIEADVNRLAWFRQKFVERRAVGHLLDHAALFELF